VHEMASHMHRGAGLAVRATISECRRLTFPTVCLVPPLSCARDCPKSCKEPWQQQNTINSHAVDLELRQFARVISDPGEFQKECGFDPVAQKMPKSIVAGPFGKEQGWIVQDKSRPTEVQFVCRVGLRVDTAESTSSRQVRVDQGSGMESDSEHNF
jgi:hypothetical protein